MPNFIALPGLAIAFSSASLAIHNCIFHIEMLLISHHFWLRGNIKALT